jgi:hypothetical protein
MVIFILAVGCAAFGLFIGFFMGLAVGYGAGVEAWPWR